MPCLSHRDVATNPRLAGENIFNTQVNEKMQLIIRNSVIPRVFLKYMFLQCSNGHALCQRCKRNPNINRYLSIGNPLHWAIIIRKCPTCRQQIIGRATTIEKIAASLHYRCWKQPLLDRSRTNSALDSYYLD